MAYGGKNLKKDLKRSKKSGFIVRVLSVRITVMCVLAAPGFFLASPAGSMTETVEEVENVSLNKPEGSRRDHIPGRDLGQGKKGTGRGISADSRNDVAWNVFIGTIGDVLLKLKEGFGFGMDISETFDSNIYNTWGGNNRWDLITRISPKVRYELSPENFGGILYGNKGKSRTDIMPLLQVAMDMDVEYYARHFELNNINKADSFFQPKLSVGLEPEKDLKLNFSTAFKRQNMSDLNPIAWEKKEKKIDTRTTSYGVDYTFGPRSNAWNVGFSRTDFWHGGGRSDLDRHVADWRVMTDPDTRGRRLPRLFADYRGQYSSQNDGKKNTHEFYAGLTGRFSPKIRGTAKAGYGFGFPGGEAQKTRSGFVSEVNVLYNITDRFSCDLNFYQTLQDSYGAGYAGVGEFFRDFNLPRSLRRTLGARAGFTYVPPFFMENLSLTGTVSSREFIYSDGSVQKAQEAGIGYKYVWRHKNRPRKQTNVRKKPIMWGSEWAVEGNFKTRKVSPDTGWSKYSGNVATLQLTTEF